MVIIGNESWIRAMIEKQNSSCRSGSARSDQKKVQQVRSSTESLVIVLFDIKGIDHRKFVPSSSTVNSDFYCNVLKCLRDAQEKRL